MAQPARTYNLTRRGWLMAGLGIGVSALASRARGAVTLVPRLDGDTLYISAPDFHFLDGRPLERLKDGNTVIFIAQLSLSLDGNRTFIRQQPQKFVFSYDLWGDGEKFWVTRPGNMPRKGLTQRAAETWCLDSLAISTSGIAADKLLWLTLDFRVADLRDQSKMVGDSGLSVRGLVDALSKPARTQQAHWTLDVVPPFRLGDLRRSSGRGSRSG